jgi:ribonuclease VapC
MVMESTGGYNGLRDFDLFIAAAGIELIPVDADQAQIAREAFRRYGKGRSPAGLNYGDCFSYALAKATGLPLLFKGADFARTDIESAL